MLPAKYCLGLAYIGNVSLHIIEPPGATYFGKHELVQFLFPRFTINSGLVTADGCLFVAAITIIELCVIAFVPKVIPLQLKPLENLHEEDELFADEKYWYINKDASATTIINIIQVNLDFEDLF